MKEITLQEILSMTPQETVTFFTGLDMEERMRFYQSLLDRHKDHFANQIEAAMGARKFADLAAEAGIDEKTPFEELERLAKEENHPAAQYYLSRICLERWKAAHPYQPLGGDYTNEEPGMAAMQNDWENARRWAIECTEQDFNEGLYAQALCYDRVTYPPYYTKKLILDFNHRFAIIRYEAVVVEKYDRQMALSAAVRLGEIYTERPFDELRSIDEMRGELQDHFEYKCRMHRENPTEENKAQAEYALDNLRYYDEKRIAAAECMEQEHPEHAAALAAYRAFHERLLKEVM